MKEKTCAFTGHRPNRLPWREEDPRCAALKAILAEQIEALAADGVTDFFSGMALGVDTWAALAVLALRERDPSVRLHCVLPCEGQESGWLPEEQALYRAILARADSAAYVCRAYRKGCMLERDRRLVESAGMLLAVFSGTRRSGTGATVRYARKLGREILVIDPASLSITREPPENASILLR